MDKVSLELLFQITKLTAKYFEEVAEKIRSRSKASSRPKPETEKRKKTKTGIQLFSEDLSRKLTKLAEYAKSTKAELDDIISKRWVSLTDPEKREWDGKARVWTEAHSTGDRKSTKLPQKRKAEPNSLSDTESDREMQKRTKQSS